MIEPPFFVRPPAAAEVPLLISIPHTGTDVPEEIAVRFASTTVSELPDTDWHLHDLWDFAPELGATTVFARFSRYVVDLNRPPDQEPLYPGRDETGLVPVSTFANEPIYRAGREPTSGEIAERVERHWRPYHARLSAELERLRERFGYALLFDAHSIQSVVPRFFDGELPVLMLGDVEGRSAAQSISAAVLDVHARSGVSYRANDPFKGGYITRSFGDPPQSVHALQLEMSQRAYMEEGSPFAYRPDLAAEIRPVLRDTLRAFLDGAARLAR